MKKQFSSSIDADLKKEAQMYCVETDQSLNNLIENSLYLFLAIAKNKKWDDIADCLPTGSFKGNELQQFAYSKDGSTKFM